MVFGLSVVGGDDLAECLEVRLVSDDGIEAELLVAAREYLGRV